MTYRIPMMLATVVALSTGSAYASIAFPTSTDEARAAAAAANPRSTHAAGGYTLRDVKAVQTPPSLKSNNGDEIRAAIAQATSTSTRAAGGHDPSSAPGARSCARGGGLTGGQGLTTYPPGPARISGTEADRIFGTRTCLLCPSGAWRPAKKQP